MEGDPLAGDVDVDIPDVGDDSAVGKTRERDVGGHATFMARVLERHRGSREYDRSTFIRLRHLTGVGQTSFADRHDREAVLLLVLGDEVDLLAGILRRDLDRRGCRGILVSYTTVGVGDLAERRDERVVGLRRCVVSDERVASILGGLGSPLRTAGDEYDGQKADERLHGNLLEKNDW